VTHVDDAAEAMIDVCWQGNLTFNDYRRMAEAAIKALGVVEEKRALGVTGWENPVEGVTYIARRSRLVSPWDDQ
jgi:hypothetical protein